MKKVLALVLAVLMISTVAFAAAANAPGAKLKIENASGTPTINAGVFTLTTGDDDGNKTTFDKDLLNANYSVTGIRYNEGKNLVKGITIDDGDEVVVIELVQDYDNTKEKTLDVEFTLKGKGKYRDSGTGANTSVSDVKIKVVTTVGYEVKKVSLGVDGNNSFDLKTVFPTVASLKGKLVKFEKGGTAGAPAAAAASSWGDMNYDYSDALSLEVRVYDGNQLYLFENNDANKAVLKANADTDAEMFFFNFPGNPTFDATARLYFNDADKDHIVYSIKDNVLTKAGAYSEDDGCWVVKARTLGSYVVSDKELVSGTSAAAADATPANPDTGANDVVGIATALAAVALVSAAAVSLKK